MMNSKGDIRVSERKLTKHNWSICFIVLISQLTNSRLLRVFEKRFADKTFVLQQ